MALAAIVAIFAVKLAIETFVPRKELPPPKTTLATFKPERKQSPSKRQKCIGLRLA